MTTWYEFTEAIKAARDDLGSPDIVWYRGQRDQRWGLEPSLIRFSNGLDNEEKHFRSFAQRSKHLTEQVTNWDTLFLMQHYYVPTRLLDWSEALGVSVFFAIMGWHRNGDTSTEPCIWVLDPLALNKLSTSKSEIKYASEEFEYFSIYVKKRPTRVVNPIAIRPPHANERMRAQRGAFTIHGDDTRPLNEIYPECMRQVVLPVATIPSAREFLEYANINQFTVFPDLVGLAPFIKELAGLTT